MPRNVDHTDHQRCIPDVGLCVDRRGRVISTATGRRVAARHLDLVQHAALYVAGY